MKKSYFLGVILLSLMTLSTIAQENGIRAGWNNSVLVNDGTSFDALPGFYVGYFRIHNLGPDILGINTGLEYFQNGIKVDDDNYRKLHELSVPIALRVKLGPVYAIGGAGLNFKLSEKLVVAGNEVTLTDDTKSEFFDVPVILGVGVKIAIVSIEARYHWGLLEAQPGSKYQYFQVGAGIHF